MNTNSKVGGILSIVAGGIGVLKAAYFLVRVPEIPEI